MHVCNMQYVFEVNFLKLEFIVINFKTFNSTGR